MLEDFFDRASRIDNDKQKLELELRKHISISDISTILSKFVDHRIKFAYFIHIVDEKSKNLLILNDYKDE